MVDILVYHTGNRVRANICIKLTRVPVKGEYVQLDAEIFQVVGVLHYPTLGDTTPHARVELI